MKFKCLLLTLVLAGALQSSGLADEYPITARTSSTPWKDDTVLKSFSYFGSAKLKATVQVAEAYIYAFPLVLTYTTWQSLSGAADSVLTDNRLTEAALNQLNHVTQFPDASCTDVVAVNTDTLTTWSFMDLTAEPLVLHVPAMDVAPSGNGDRYYVIPFYDPWTNVYYTIGSRTTGNQARDYAVVGPDWQGKLPEGIVRIDSPYNSTWIAARIYCAGGDDVANVHDLQDQFDLRPLSGYGRDFYSEPVRQVVPPADTSLPPSQEILTMDAVSYFDIFKKLLVSIPPLYRDYKMMDELCRLGMFWGEDFDPDKLDPIIASVLDIGVDIGRSMILQVKSEIPMVNGWKISNTEEFYTGAYDTNYLYRAFVALMGYGAVLTADALYPHAETDSAGNPLTNFNSYRIHFEPGQLPPVNAFWSLTIYNRNRFFVDEINLPDPSLPTCYSVHSVDVQSSHYNADGSLDIYVTTFANKEAHVPADALWLPSPTPGNERFQPAGSQGLPSEPNTAPFTIALRLFWPDADVLEGEWEPPLIEAYE